MTPYRTFLDTFQQVGTLEMTQRACHSECHAAAWCIEERYSLITKK